MYHIIFGHLFWTAVALQFAEAAHQPLQMVIIAYNFLLIMFEVAGNHLAEDEVM